MASHPRYPLMLDLAGQRCLVVGGGPVALRKARGLVEAGADVTVVAPVLDPALAQLAGDRRVTWTERAVLPGDDELVATGRWRLVVAATNDAELNASIARRCGQVGTWVIDVSSDSGGSASTPAVHRQGPVTVAVSTTGVSPSAAAWLRDELAGAIDPAVVEALELLAEVIAEAEVSGHSSWRAPRLDWQRVLDSGTLDDIRHGHRARAKERLQACLSSSSD